ncbi:hypothetical protein NQ318_008525 [Aromia moschata]|uniref:Peptidase C1A papain C-terminal domain-containing protein n=1 Tax=Aromia moschata TaxID=1265417 RepID=A0AAV8X112_9CUCU|nr:hypothetical protein NQ318_008525 [Aromia moschata]
MNPLGDLAFAEFNKLYNGFKGLLAGGASKAPVYQPPRKSLYLIASIGENWVQFLRYSTNRSVLDAGSLEGQNFKKKGKLEDVSVQNILDCAKGKVYNNDGCQGGLVETAFDYIQDNRGVNSAANYPYEAKDGTCRFKQDDVVANCTGYVRIPSGDEKSLEKAVAKQGPISVAIHVVDKFQFYSNGVYYDPQCGNKPDDLNHAVVLVGYGKEPNGQKYWLVKIPMVRNGAWKGT